MPRYIDADALIEKINNHEKNVKCGDRKIDEIYEIAHEHIIELVEMQPTAYDPDAVAAELKELCIPIDGDFMNYTENAVEIVRKGGVHE